MLCFVLGTLVSLFAKVLHVISRCVVGLQARVSTLSAKPFCQLKGRRPNLELDHLSACVRARGAGWNKPGTRPHQRHVHVLAAVQGDYALFCLTVLGGPRG